MLIQFTNTALLTLVVLQTLTGLFVLFWPVSPFVMDLHRWGSWALLGLLPWKAVIVYRSLARGLKKTWDRGLVPILSSLMAGLLILILAAGLAWTWRIGDWLVLLGQTVISWHWVFGLVILPFFIIHIWRRWPNPSRRFLLTRRAAVRAMGFGAFGVVGWLVAERLAEKLEAEEHPRSPNTGSREYRSFSGNAMPVTTNFGENPRRLDPEMWQLRIDGLVENPLEISYPQLMEIPSKTVIATVDCTVGWYSTQRWQGIPVMDLVRRADPAASATFLRFWSDTGYNKSFSLAEAENILLGTHVGDEPINHSHGFPVRAVVPGWRGWFWVKWMTRVQVVSRPAA